MSLLIGQYIAYALENNTGVTEKVGERIFPIIAPLAEDVDFPYIVYASNSMTEASTKDGIHSDTVQEEILVFGRDLEEVEETAQAVREAMEAAWTDWNEQDSPAFVVEDQVMSAGAEDFALDHDGYFITLNYMIETSDEE